MPSQKQLPSNLFGKPAPSFPPEESAGGLGGAKTPIPPAGSPNPATMRLGSCPQSSWTRPNPPVPKDEGFLSMGSGKRPRSWCEAGSGGLSLSITPVDAHLGKAGGRAGAVTAQPQPQHHEFGKDLVSQDGLGWKGP